MIISLILRREVNKCTSGLRYFHTQNCELRERFVILGILKILKFIYNTWVILLKIFSKKMCLLKTLLIKMLSNAF